MIRCLNLKGQDCLPRGWSYVTTCIWRLVPLSSLERRRRWSPPPCGSCPQCGRAAFCQQSGRWSSQEVTLELNQPESCEACREASDTSCTPPKVERREDPLIVTWSCTSLSVLRCSSQHYLRWTLQSEEPAEHSAVKPSGHVMSGRRGGELYT